jgi:23S rRNA (uridine2552-2'-O)-methyltransferase
MCPPSRSTKIWLRAHAQDPFVRRAQRDGYRARAVYKLMEIDRQHHLLRPGMTVIDLGAAPGGWSQYARERVGARGRVLAQDLSPMDPLPGVELIRGDIADPAVLDLILERLASHVELVISDIAPHITGDRVRDQAGASALAMRVLEVAEATLKAGGELLLKTFQGEEFSGLRAAMQERFTSVLTCKPQASRARSREIYLLGKGFRASNVRRAKQL